MPAVCELDDLRTDNKLNYRAPLEFLSAVGISFWEQILGRSASIVKMAPEVPYQSHNIQNVPFSYSVEVVGRAWGVKGAFCKRGRSGHRPAKWLKVGSCVT